MAPAAAVEAGAGRALDAAVVAWQVRVVAWRAWRVGAGTVVAGGEEGRVRDDAGLAGGVEWGTDGAAGAPWALGVTRGLTSIPTWRRTLATTWLAAGGRTAAAESPAVPATRPAIEPAAMATGAQRARRRDGWDFSRPALRKAATIAFSPRSSWASAGPEAAAIRPAIVPR